MSVVVEAHGCGAIGCHETKHLRRVERDGQVRVLCPEHARDFLRGGA